MGEWAQIIIQGGLLGVIALAIWRWPQVIQEQRQTRAMELAHIEREREADRSSRHQMNNQAWETILRIMTGVKEEAKLDRAEFERRNAAMLGALDRHTVAMAEKFDQLLAAFQAVAVARQASGSWPDPAQKGQP